MATMSARLRVCWPWLPATILMLALASARADASASPLSDAGPVLEDLGRQVQDVSRPEAERLHIVKVLGQWGTSQVRAPLLAILKDPSTSIRAASATALGWAGNREAVAALRERIEAEGENAAVRAAALESLGRIGDDSVRALVLAATRDGDAKVRSAALWSVTFGSLASPTDRTVFLRQVAEDRGLDLLMRCQSMLTIGELKDTGAADLLIRLLEREPPIAMPLPADTASQREIMMVRYREARDVRAWAAMVLGLVEAKMALPLILKAAEDPDDFFLRLTSVRTLVAWNAPEALPVLIRRLDDPFPDTRIAALVGLSKIGDRAVVDSVLARLSDRFPGVRAQAINTLAELGDSRVRPRLEALQQTDPDPSVQGALESALARLGR